MVNQGGTVPIVGQTGGYTADIANSQEVNIQVSGALGESETGGSEINIVPRTGGNRFAGNFNWTFTNENLFGANNGAYPNITSVLQPVKSDQDLSVGVGGPIMRDKLWFYSVGRDQRIHKLPVGIDFWPNKWEGKYGYNYQPDRSKARVEYHNIWRNVNAPHHVAGVAEEQVRLLLGRAGLLPGPVHSAWCRSSPRRSRGGPSRSSRTACSRCRGRTR